MVCDPETIAIKGAEVKIPEPSMKAINEAWKGLPYSSFNEVRVILKAAYEIDFPHAGARQELLDLVKEQASQLGGLRVSIDALKKDRACFEATVEAQALRIAELERVRGYSDEASKFYFDLCREKDNTISELQSELNRVRSAIDVARNTK